MYYPSAFYQLKSLLGSLIVVLLLSSFCAFGAWFFFDFTVALGTFYFSILISLLLPNNLIPLWLTRQKIISPDPNSDRFNRIKLGHHQLGINQFKVFILPINWPLTIIMPFGRFSKILISEPLYRSWQFEKDDLWLLRAHQISTSPWNFVALISASLWICGIKILRANHQGLLLLSKIDAHEKADKTVHFEKFNMWLFFIFSLPFFGLWKFLNWRFHLITQRFLLSQNKLAARNWEESTLHQFSQMRASLSSANHVHSPNSQTILTWMAFCPYLPYQLDIRSLLSNQITGFMLPKYHSISEKLY